MKGKLFFYRSKKNYNYCYFRGKAMFYYHPANEQICSFFILNQVTKHFWIRFMDLTVIYTLDFKN
jgi:hypothetical protein